jgi:hypothetical protein
MEEGSSVLILVVTLTSIGTDFVTPRPWSDFKTKQDNYEKCEGMNGK